MKTQEELMLAAMTEMLERSGHTPASARLLASDMLQRQGEVTAGCSWGGVHAEFLPQLWAQATHGGNQRRLLLEITCEGETYADYHGHIHVEVKDAQTWAQYEAARPQGVN